MLIVEIICKIMPHPRLLPPSMPFPVSGPIMMLKMLLTSGPSWLFFYNILMCLEFWNFMKLGSNV